MTMPSSPLINSIQQMIRLNKWF